MTKPSIPQGTRDFGPDVVRKRNYILNTIKNVFELYGFQPLETPAMENIETLMGKYGEESDKLIYRILDSGNPFSENFFLGFWEYLKDFNSEVNKNSPGIFPSGGPLSDWNLLEYSPAILSSLAQDLFDNPTLNKKYLSKFKKDLSSKALRYDLTIPFARYVAMNHNKLTFPFKRYQVQPVWRADRPQKGRYREFYQCDADVVGSNSLLSEIELANIYHDVFIQLGIKNYELRINHRKILTALAELCGGAEKMNDIAIVIDKLDKIGLEKVKEELKQRGLSKEQIVIVEKYLSVSGSNKEKLIQLNKLLGLTESGKKGVKEIQGIFDNYHLSSINYHLDPALARGLNYYTGIIFEAKTKDVQIGSIGGGGRYDDLTGLFGVPDIPGIGISFGVDRIYDVMEELKLFPTSLLVSTQVLFFNSGKPEINSVLFALMQKLRRKSIRCEMYDKEAGINKQFKYAENKNIPYVVIMNFEDLDKGLCEVKDIREWGKPITFKQEDLMTYPFKF